MDLTLFRLLNGLAGYHALLDGAIVFLASYLQYVLGILLFTLALWPPRRLRLFVTALGAGVIARFAVKPLIILFVHRARPFAALEDVRNIIGIDAGQDLESFPSGHAVFFFALAMVVYRYDRRWGYVFFAGALLMGIARVAGGVHWPSDILVGALLGMLVGWTCAQLTPPLLVAMSSQK